MKQNPYVTKVGRDWIVLDANGDDTFSTTNKTLAFMFMNNNYPELRDCKLPIIKN